MFLDQHLSALSFGVGRFSIPGRYPFSSAIVISGFWWFPRPTKDGRFSLANFAWNGKQLCSNTWLPRILAVHATGNSLDFSKIDRLDKDDYAEIIIILSRICAPSPSMRTRKRSLSFRALAGTEKIKTHNLYTHLGDFFFPFFVFFSVQLISFSDFFLAPLLLSNSSVAVK